MSSLLTPTWTVLAPLLDPVPAPEDVNPGWIALIVLLSLAAVTVLLYFSLRKHLRKVDDMDKHPEADGRADDDRNGSNPA